MPPVPFNFAGQVGINKDLAPHELNPPAWSDGRNMLFRDGKVIRDAGSQQVFGTPTVVPYWLMFAFSATDAFWMYSDLVKMYATDGQTHSDITRAAGGDYAATVDRLWQGGMLSGIPVITNGVDKPQSWSPVGLGTDLVDLPNWPANDRARVIKPFKTFLVAGHIIRSGTPLPHMVMWSHPAAPGSVPDSWDVSDPTKLAGERDLGDPFPGGIIEMLALRDIFIIYKNNTTWGMQFIGGQEVMRTWMILESAGALAPHCVKEVHEGQAHVIGASDDFIVFDGQSAKSIVDKKMRKFIADILLNNQAAAQRSFVFTNNKDKEAWYCIPEPGNDWPNIAIIWNYRDNTLAIKDMVIGTSLMDAGVVSDTSSVWNVDSGTWDSDTTVWDIVTFRSQFYSMLGSVPDSNKIIEYGVGQQHDGVNYTSYVERTDIALVGKDRLTGEYKGDLENRKLGKRIWPKMKPGSSPINIQLGWQDKVGGPVTWQALQSFDASTQQYLDFSVAGLLLAVRMESTVPGEHSIEGFDIEVELVGRM